MGLDTDRQRLLLWRRGLDHDQVERSSRLVAERASAALERPGRVAAYIAVRGEIDPQPLLDAWRLCADDVALPMVADDRLEFVTGSHRLERRTFGITEPLDGIGTTLTEVTMVIVPIVAFDRAGNRLGHGYGYYDRALAAVLHDDRRALFVGLAYDEQQLDTITPHERDVPMDIIITPSRVIDADRATSGRG